jgi:hypothetical protein
MLRGACPRRSVKSVALFRAGRCAAADARYLRDRAKYRLLSEAEPIRWRDAFPRVQDGPPSSFYDTHYFFQDTWAASRPRGAAPTRHVGVASPSGLRWPLSPRSAKSSSSTSGRSMPP